MRDLFEDAKKNAPCIVFIDEIDAVARRRGTGMGGGHDEREQTLNQMLVEMDGFGVNEGIIVMAATNRVDILDPAIMRPGRFDRKVVVGRPDVGGREEILGVHAKKKPLAEDVDLKQIAQTTAGFTGADLENLMNEAAIRAAAKTENISHRMISENPSSRLVSELRRRAVSSLTRKSASQPTTRQDMQSFSICFQMWDLYTQFQSSLQEQAQQATPCLCLRRMRCSTQRDVCFRKS